MYTTPKPRTTTEEERDIYTTKDDGDKATPDLRPGTRVEVPVQRSTPLTLTVVHKMETRPIAKTQKTTTVEVDSAATLTNKATGVKTLQPVTGKQASPDTTEGIPERITPRLTEEDSVILQTTSRPKPTLDRIITGIPTTQQTPEPTEPAEPTTDAVRTDTVSSAEEVKETTLSLETLPDFLPPFPPVTPGE